MNSFSYKNMFLLNTVCGQQLVDKRKCCTFEVFHGNKESICWFFFVVGKKAFPKVGTFPKVGMEFMSYLGENSDLFVV